MAARHSHQMEVKRSCSQRRRKWNFSIKVKREGNVPLVRLIIRTISWIFNQLLPKFIHFRAFTPWLKLEIAFLWHIHWLRATTWMLLEFFYMCQFSFQIRVVFLYWLPCILRMSRPGQDPCDCSSAATDENEKTKQMSEVELRER